MYFKKIEFSVLIGLCITLALSCFDFSYKCENIRQSVFRLHILANSNSEYDQKLKIKVRDRLLNEGLEVFANSEDLEETILLAEENLDKFISCANDELIKNIINYDEKNYCCKLADFMERIGSYEDGHATSCSPC